jgi:peroxiredoxin
VPDLGAERDPYALPKGLPVPVDDGAAAHLPGAALPDVTLRSTDDEDVRLAELGQHRLVLYVYPKTGRPGEADPPGWDATPGARGCTPQSCAFRDHHREFLDLGYSVAGLSAQEPEDQLEAAERLHLPFPLLADPALELARDLRLPTFDIAGLTLYKRLTLVVQEGRIVQVFYPVFPPNENAEAVLDWIRSS